MILIYCGWVLSLPLFPTQDGALHLYYVHALHQLTGGNSLFSHSYAWRSPVPPYSIQYALLYALTSIVDSVWAEKIMVCLILITTATGFRSLAKTIGDAGAVISLWIFPLALGWPLFMGFHNFCLSLGFSLWALTFWLRAASGRRGAFLLFGCSILIVEFTHPVPLLILIGVVFADLCIRAGQLRYSRFLDWKQIVKKLQWEIVSFLAAASSLSYLALFLNKPSVVTAASRTVSLMAWCKQIALLQFMCFASGGVATKLFRLFLLTLLFFFLWVGWRSFKERWLTKRLDASSTMLVCCVSVILLLPLIPSRVNGLDYFRERLFIYGFIFALAAASASRGLSRKYQTALYLGALVFAGYDLAMAEKLVRPVAQEVAQVETLSVRARNKTGLMFNASRIIGPRRLMANPYHVWSGSRFFRRSNTLLLNDPWAGPPNILPINRSANRLNVALTNFELLNPLQLYQEMLESKAARDRVLSQTDFIFFVGLPQSAGVVDPLLEASGRSWDCRQGGWFFFCEVNRQATKTTITPLDQSSAVAHSADTAFTELNARRFWEEE